MGLRGLADLGGVVSHFLHALLNLVEVARAGLEQVLHFLGHLAKSRHALEHLAELLAAAGDLLRAGHQRGCVGLLLLPRLGHRLDQLLHVRVDPILTLGGAGKSVGRPLEALLAVELDVSSLRGQVLEAAQLVVQGQRRLRQLTRLVRRGHLTKLSRALAAGVPQVR